MAVAAVLRGMHEHNPLVIERLTPADLVNAKDQNLVLKKAFETVLTSGQPPFRGLNFASIADR